MGRKDSSSIAASDPGIPCRSSVKEFLGNSAERSHPTILLENRLINALRTIALLVALSAASTSFAAEPEPPAQVMVIGSFHFSNPGRDMFNVQMDDVLSEPRQAELARLVEGLATFAPDTVMVEWPQALTDQRYAAFRAGTLEPSRNEAVQLGFRVANQAGLQRVHGIDASGEFPFAPVEAYAETHGGGAQLGAAMTRIGHEVALLNQRIATDSIGSLLRHLNAPGRALRSHRFYIDMLRFGQGEEQPGAALVSAWYARNLTICAKLLQALPPRGRAVVFYGDGHAYLLRQCVIEAPGVELIEPGEYLVD